VCYLVEEKLNGEIEGQQVDDSYSITNRRIRRVIMHLTRYELAVSEILGD